ncbi:MAG: dephospho-CoA kinase [Brevinema sp.]
MNKVLGLYGQAGTGKSTVSQYFKNQGWDYINQDVLGHHVLEEYPKELVLLFGEEILTDQVVDRKKLGQLVFSHADLLQKLVNFSYPIIIKKTNSLLQSGRNTIIEGAFFYKVRQSISHTHLMYIFVEATVLVDRLLQRGHSELWIQQVLLSQQDIILNADLADFVLDNSSDLPTLYRQIELIQF